MEVSHITVTVLRRLLTLSEKKEALLNEIGAIDKELASLSTGKVTAVASAKTAPVAVSKGAKRGPKPGKRGRRGALKAKILAILSEAGQAGARVKDIAAKLGAKPQNIHVWFSSTGKNLPNLKRMEAGLYKLISPAAAAPAPVVVAPKPAAAAAPAKRGRKPGKVAKKTKALKKS